MSDKIAGGQLRAFVERVERIEADIKEMNADKSAIYKEIRGEGYDVKTVRKIVAKRKLDTDERDEQDAIFDLYWDALYGSQSHARAHARENIEQFPQSKAEKTGLEVASTANAFDAIAATNSHSHPTSSPDADKTGTEPPPSVSVTLSDDDCVPAFLRNGAMA